MASGMDEKSVFSSAPASADSADDKHFEICVTPVTVANEDHVKKRPKNRGPPSSFAHSANRRYRFGSSGDETDVGSSANYGSQKSRHAASASDIHELPMMSSRSHQHSHVQQKGTRFVGWKRAFLGGF